MEGRLSRTILEGDKDAFLALVQENEDSVKQMTVSGSSILHLTARFGHVGLAREVVKLWPEMAGSENERMETPLHEACRRGKLEIVKMLVEIDEGSVYRLNRENQSVLFVASEKGKTDVVIWLLSKFPQVLMLENDGVTTSLHVSAFNGHIGNLIDHLF